MFIGVIFFTSQLRLRIQFFNIQYSIKMITTNKKEAINNEFCREAEIKIIEKKTSGITNDLGSRFKEKLKILYWTEKTILKAIPGMIRNAKSEELVEALEYHRSINKEQVLRLEAVFALINIIPEAKHHNPIALLIKEAEKTLQSNKGMVRDAEAISLIQEVQHLEIALYGSLCSFARTLGEEMVMLLMEDALFDEKESDKNMSMVAEAFVNPVAAYGYPVRIEDNQMETVCIVTKKGF